jgi:hypothetical protein
MGIRVICAIRLLGAWTILILVSPSHGQMEWILTNQVQENLSLMERNAVSAGKYLSTLESHTILRNVGNSTPM